NGGKNSLNRLIRCVCGKKIGPDPRNFNQRVSLGRNDLLIRTFLSGAGTPQKHTTQEDRTDKSLFHENTNTVNVNQHYQGTALTCRGEHLLMVDIEALHQLRLFCNVQSFS
ncbi:hypothetical protein AB0166_13345, partial [Klebsiella pneumoniae]